MLRRATGGQVKTGAEHTMLHARIYTMAVQCNAPRCKRFHGDEERNPLDRCNHSSLVAENAKKPHKEAYLVQTVKRKSHGGLPGDRGAHMDLPRV
jgi:hypothetical protein